MSRRKPQESLVAIIALLGLLGGWPASAPARLQADLRFSQTTCEVGEVRGGTVLSPRFTFTNVGTIPVEITEVRPGCGCLKPRLSQRTVQPGETGQLELEVDTRRESAGPHVWQLDLRWQHGAAVQESTLRVEGRVVTEVTVQPPALTLLADEPGISTVVVTDLRPAPLTIRAVATSSLRVRAVLGTPQHSPLNHQTWTIRLEPDAACPPGRHEEVLTIHTGDPDYPTLEVPVTVVKREPARVEVQPKSLLFRLAAGQEGKRSVSLRDRQGQGVSVDGISTDHEAVTCTVAPRQAGQVTLTIRVDPAKVPAGGFSSAVRVRLSGPTQETIVLPVDCTVD